MQVTRFEFIKNHLARNAPVRGQRTNPREHRAREALARSYPRLGRAGRVRQHRAIRAVEPGVDNFFFLAKVHAYVIQRYAQRASDIVQAQRFPGRFLRARERGIDDGIACDVHISLRGPLYAASLGLARTPRADYADWRINASTIATCKISLSTTSGNRLRTRNKLPAWRQAARSRSARGGG